MTHIEASNFAIKAVNDFALEAVKRGMINDEKSMASFVNDAANFLNIPAEIVFQIVFKIADSIK